MGTNEMPQKNNEKILSPHELAKKFEAQIKGVVVEKFSPKAEDLSLLLEDKVGVYLSKEEPDTLCSFVVDQKGGYLYMVSAKMEDNGKQLINFKCHIVS
jgi:hypothetical protein